MSAPLSTRNEHCDEASKTDIDPEDEVLSETMPGVVDARRWRFPDFGAEEVQQRRAWCTSEVRHTGKLHGRNSDERSTDLVSSCPKKNGGAKLAPKLARHLWTLH